MGAPPVMIKQKQSAFTIVELLIVIVVIGILAAITIVAYNGVQSRAVAASLQADLSNASKKLKLYQVDNGAYPIALDCTASPAAKTICIKSSNGTSYTTFTPNNTTSAQTFCLTATNGTTKYFISQDSTPGNGTCTITNLTTNTSVETDTSNLQNIGNVSDRTLARTAAADAHTGAYVFRLTVGPSGGVAGYGSNSITVPVGRYTGSVWVRSSIAIGVNPYFEGSAGRTNIAQQGATLVPNTWTRVWSMIDVTSPGTVKVGFLSGGAGTAAPGDYVDIDSFMLVQGSTVYTFADGSSPGWSWTGVVNASTSTGSPL